MVEHNEWYISLVAAATAWASGVKSDVGSLISARSKVFNAALEVLAVEQECLDALAYACEMSVSQGTVDAAWACANAALARVDLILAYSSFVGVVLGPSGSDSAHGSVLRDGTGITVWALDSSQLTRCVVGGSEARWRHNTVRLRCLDGEGRVIGSILPEDIACTVTCGEVQAVGVSREGVATVTFSVPVSTPPVASVTVSAAVCGIPAQGSPWTLRPAVFETRSPPATVGTVRLLARQRRHGIAGPGLAVSPRGDTLVLTNAHSLGDMVSVYALPSGEHVRSFGTPGDAVGQFNLPWDVCFTGAGTLLIAECGNKRVQEVDVHGVHQRYIDTAAQFLGPVWSVDTTGPLVAVGTGDWTLCQGHIALFDYDTGACVRRFGTFGFQPGMLLHIGAVRFCPDGARVLVSDAYQHRLLVYTVGGEYVKGFETDAADALAGSRPDGFAYGGNGDVVVACGRSRELLALHPDGQRSVLAWGAGLQLTSVACVGNHLYALDATQHCVHVFAS